MDFIGVKIDVMRNKTVLNKVMIQKFIDYLNAERKTKMQIIQDNDILLFIFHHSGSCCGKAGDRCENGKCKCGSRESCSGASDTCINGKCFCGSRLPCSLPASNRCLKGRCLCGVNFPCDPVGVTPICLDDDLQIPSQFDSKPSCKVSIIFYNKRRMKTKALDKSFEI